MPRREHAVDGVLTTDRETSRPSRSFSPGHIAWALMILWAACTTTGMFGCAPLMETPVPGRPAEEHFSKNPPLPELVHTPPAPPPLSPPPEGLSVKERMPPLLSPAGSIQKGPPNAQFSFRAQDMPLQDALVLFARAYQLNIVSSPEVRGTITVDFHNLSLEVALRALLSAHGYYWVRQENLIVVRGLETRTFTIDYIRLVRGGTTRSTAQVQSGGSQGGGAIQEAGVIALNQTDQIKFWEELETQLKVLLSDHGHIVVNRLSGTIQVTDRHIHVENIAEFLAQVRRALYRQVEIEARIYEVVLNEDYSLGIDWNEVKVLEDNGTIMLANIVGTPIGGFVAKAATTALGFQGGSFDLAIKALQEQGDLKILSQPKIVTLNNQPALIKVGTDQSFFVSTVIQGTGTSPPIVTEQVRTVTTGLVLALTPQISEDGWIMLDISPIITRLTDTVQSQSGSTAPILDVKQSAGLVRIRDGNLVIIGGLIQDQVSKTVRKVPVLGDLPWIGHFFRGTYEITRKSELVIFLSPRIVEL